jgi:starch synthase
MRVLFISPEAVPFAKTGGLADVAGSLPAALKRLGMEVHLVLPFYRVVRESNLEYRLLLKDLTVTLGDGELVARVWGSVNDAEVPVYLIEREDMYDRPNIYGNSLGDYYDNFERYTFFSRAALSTAEVLSIKPDLIHCHDWQTGLVPALLKGPLRNSATLGAAPTVFTIHNLGYQGLFPADKMVLAGLSREEFFRSEGLEYYGKISLLKAGIVYSDAVTTVSPSYAREIQTPEYGMGMEGVLQYRRASLHGILNGVDYQRWDPARDPHISASYSLGRMAGKQACKESLIREMNLNSLLAKRPLLGMISRLDTQKGVDLLVKVLDDMLALNVGLVVLGSGDEQIQRSIQEAADRHPGQVKLTTGFDEPLAHRIMAGADILLIPSRYEPCGLTQMYALKYGTVPVVRATGGLEDTITVFNPQEGEGNGFKFGAYESGAFLAAVQKAVKTFQDSRSWNRLMANGMKEDFSWEQSAQRYRALYESLIASNRHEEAFDDRKEAAQ